LKSRETTLQKEAVEMLTHEEIELRKNLPRVGDTVRSKKYGTLWRVMTKSERWAPIEDDPHTGNARLVPAIYLGFWKIVEGQPPGVGQMLGYLYTAFDNTFETNWEIVQ
jgi:hypothetical protein